MPAATAALALTETQRKIRGHRFYAPQAEQKKVPALGATENVPMEDKIVGLHYFGGSSDFYAVEMDTETGRCFGYVDLGFGGEWGYFSLPEVEKIRPNMARGQWVIERDCYWTPVRFADLGR